MQINERYSPRNNYDSDIAIIELAEAATLTRHVTLACLPSDTMQGNVEEGEFGLVRQTDDTQSQTLSAAWKI